MSQEKVNKYKEAKANRKEIMKKEKMQHTVRRTIVGVCSILLVAWLGYSAYNVYEASQPRETVSVDYDAISTYQELRGKFDKIPTLLRNRLLDGTIPSATINRYISSFESCKGFTHRGWSYLYFN